MRDRKDWRRVKFGDVVRLCTDRVADAAESGIERYVGLEHIDSEDLRVRRWGLVAEGTTFTTRFKPGQVLFGKRRAYQRKVAVADFEGVCSGDIYVLESASPELLPELLPFICQSEAFFRFAVETSAGSLSPRTNWTSLARFEFELPLLKAQHELVQVLSASCVVVDELVNAVLVGEDAHGAMIDEEFSGGDRVVLASVVLSSAYGPRFPATDYALEGNVRTIRTTDMPVFGRITPETAPLADVPAKMASEHQLVEGDFLMSRTGFTSGRASLFHVDTDEVYIPAAFIIRLRLDRARVIPRYLLDFFRSATGKEIVARLQRGTQQLNISCSALLRESVKVSAIERQRVFVVASTQLERAIEECRRRLDAARCNHKRLCGLLGGS